MNRVIAFTVTSMVLAGCNPATTTEQDSPTTIREAVNTLRQHEQVITKALRANNSSAADEALHDAMYLADHLDEFTSEPNIEPTKLEEESTRLLKLLLTAHRGAHGGSEEASQPAVLADEISDCVTKLETLLQ